MIVAPRRLKSAVQLLPAAMLFASLVLGGPSFIGDASSRVADTSCRDYPPGCMNTGDNTGNNIVGGGRSLEQGAVESVPVLIVAED